MILITRRKFIRNIRHIIKIIILCWLIKLVYRIFNSDKILDSIELIESWGYPAEQHNLTTDDGYILKTFRIPWSPLKLSRRNEQKPVVLILTGLGSTSDIWLINPNRSLAKQLADEGYDVWLANFRGTTYGRDHVTLSPNDKKFWDFSFHEIGYYDVPRTIDYVLNATNQSSLICVALSMGTTLSFVTLSEHPEYNSKIKLVIESGAIAGFFDKQFKDMRPITVFSTVINLIDPTGTFEMSLPNLINSILFEEFCVNLNLVDYCLLPLYIFCGQNDDQLDANIYVNLLNYFPDGTSAKTFLHYAQLANYRKFQQYDYQNEKENIDHYGTLQPPQYNLENIKSPMIIFYCLKNDPLSTFEDVTEIAKRISSRVIVEPVSDEDFNHVNFVTARDVKKIFNDRVIEYLDQFAKGKIIF
ncbi:lipase 3-like isoform X1 [Aphidius gifuensis]|uniref:lipase 3-like isoform X1 n=1 Tax=Aphidius gifuensis TaxID=684658 RepID=UPI001CDCA936|nr:lipase 3-like isoform X1 [Aphidius gifuensis]